MNGRDTKLGESTHHIMSQSFTQINKSTYLIITRATRSKHGHQQELGFHELSAQDKRAPP